VKFAEYHVGMFKIRRGIIRTEMTAPAISKYDPYIASGGAPMR
jgi:hypothetical protein